MTHRPIFAALTLSLALAACGEAEAPDAEAAASAEDGAVVEEAGGDETLAMDTERAANLPEWLPADFPLPDDFSVMASSTIGENTYLLDGSTDQPLDGLYESLAADLEAAGYDVRDRAELEEDNLVYFSGNGWTDSTIRFVDAGPARSVRISLTRAE